MESVDTSDCLAFMACMECIDSMEYRALMISNDYESLYSLHPRMLWHAWIAQAPWIMDFMESMYFLEYMKFHGIHGIHELH